MEYMCPKWPRICFACRRHNQNLSSYMTYHQVRRKSNVTGVTFWPWTAYSSRAPQFVLFDLCFLWSVLWTIVFPFAHLFCLYSGCSLIDSLWLPNSIFLIFLIVICICFILWSHDTLRLGNIDILVNSIYKGHH